jgi:DNA invertase Pin-like site-specific DNA recombinase
LRGTRSGTPIGTPRAVFNHAAVVELRPDGRSWRETATALAVSVRTARRVYAQGVAKHSARGAVISDAIKRVAGAW